MRGFPLSLSGELRESQSTPGADNIGAKHATVQYRSCVRSYAAGQALCYLGFVLIVRQQTYAKQCLVSYTVWEDFRYRRYKGARGARKKVEGFQMKRRGVGRIGTDRFGAHLQCLSEVRDQRAQ